jgi:NADH-quinone oxidoreductase subunit J
MAALQEIIFGYHAIVITLLSILVVTRKNPVHSILFMLVLFFHIASMYLFLNAEFIAALQIIVYAGAILVLFLFVVFLLNIREEVATEKSVLQWPGAIVLSGAIFVTIALSLCGMQVGPMQKYSIEYIQEVSHIKAVGTLLFTKYLFPFEVASIILLVAMIGSITLAKKNLKS